MVDFTYMLGMIHFNNFYPVPPLTVSTEPILRATALAAAYWSLPTLILPILAGYLISFSPSTSATPTTPSSISYRPGSTFPHFDALSASIIRFAATIAFGFPTMVLQGQGPERGQITLDVLGPQWRGVTSGVALAFAFAEAIVGGGSGRRR